MIVSWMTTNRCNLKCAHCYQDADECDSRELSTEEARTMISQIARAGFKIMIFSGGEPLMRDDIFELVAHAASCGLRPVFGSNGTLITPEIARKLKEAGACAMGISIDSLDAEKHDIFRGVPGAHAATLAGIEACKSVGLPFQIHTTVVDRNRNEICDITRFAKELGAMNHSVFFLVPVGRGKDISDESIDVEQNEQLLADILRAGRDAGIEVKPTCAPQFMRIAEQIGVQTRYTRGCLAGLTYCVVGSEGIVRACAYMTEDAGDVRKQPFDEIWRDQPGVSESCARKRTRAHAEPATTRAYAAAVAPAPRTTTTATSWAKTTTAPGARKNAAASRGQRNGHIAPRKHNEKEHSDDEGRARGTIALSCALAVGVGSRLPLASCCVADGTRVASDDGRSGAASASQGIVHVHRRSGPRGDGRVSQPRGCRHGQLREHLGAGRRHAGRGVRRRVSPITASLPTHRKSAISLRLTPNRSSR